MSSLSNIFKSTAVSQHNVDASAHTDLMATKENKVSGKGLSTEDYTSAEKTKLSGIATGAEVNVNADWNATSGDAQILNKPSIPTKTSDLTNDSGFTTATAVSSGYVAKATGYSLIADTKVIKLDNLPTITTIGSGLTLASGTLSFTADLSGYSLVSHTHDYTAVFSAINHTHANKADLVNGVVPTSQLPSYVDDMLEYTALNAFPATGESGKIYVAQDTNLIYRWSGSQYIEVSKSLALGETSATAYRGDRGATAYAHSQNTSGNPHGVSYSTIVGTFTASRVMVSGSDGKLAVSSVTTTVLGYLDATSSIQTQLNAKQTTITGAATTIISADLSAGYVLVSNSSGKVSVSSVLETKLGHLSNVSSDIQAQLDSKSAVGHSHSNYISDAPTDGKTYGRKDGGWVASASETFDLVSDGLLARWKLEGDFKDSSGNNVTTSQAVLGGTTWTARTSVVVGTTPAPYADFPFVYGNDILFGLLCDGKHWYSTDANRATWTTTNLKINALSFANGKFWKYESNSYYNSDDGLTWTERANFGKVGDDFGSSVVTYFQGKYVLLDTPTSSNYSTKIFTSSDGSNWSILSNKIGTSNAGNLFRIQVENDILFIHDYDNCKTFYTSDLITFTEISWGVDCHPYKIVFGLDIYFVIGTTNWAKKSNDLSTWDNDSLGNAALCYDLIFDGGAFISIYQGVNTVYNSPDGINWTSRTCSITSLRHLFHVAETGVNVASSIANSGNKIASYYSSVCFPYDSTLKRKVGKFSYVSYLTFSDSTFPAGASPITMGGWVKTPYTATACFFSYGLSTSYRSLQLASNYLATYYYQTVQQNSYYYILDAWVHWVVAYDSANIKVYVNGDLIACLKAPSTWATTLSTGRLGATVGNGSILKGSLSDFRVYGRSLKTDEIKKWYAGLG